MPRNRVIYNSEALFAGQKCGDACFNEDEGVNSIKQIHRVQSVNYSFNIARTDVNQYGELAAIDRIITDTPTVALDFSYYLANFANEENLGFNVGVTGRNAGNNNIDPFSDDENVLSSVQHFLDKSKDQRNYFIQTSAEGVDAVSDQDDREKQIIGIGNGHLTSYGVEASVGGLPTVNVAVEGLNMTFEDGLTLKASGFGTSDYANSWKTTTGDSFSTTVQNDYFVSGRPVLYDGSNNLIQFISGVTGDGVSYSGYLVEHKNSRDGSTDNYQEVEKWTHSGVRLPSINPVDGTKSNGVYFLPTPSGHAGADISGLLQLSVIRPGDIRMYFRENDDQSRINTSGYSSDRTIFGRKQNLTIPGAILPTESGYQSPSLREPGQRTLTSAHIQSFSLNFGLSRTPLQRMGVKHAFSREVDFPVNVGLSVDALVSDITTGNLSELINCDKNYDVSIEMCAPADCVSDVTKTTHDIFEDGRIPVATYVIKNAKLDSQAFSSSIGSNKSVTFDFSCQIGGPNQSGNGLYLKGVTPNNMTNHTNIYSTTDTAFKTERYAGPTL